MRTLAWQTAGRPDAALDTVAFGYGSILRPGEPADSPRVIAEVGPRAATLPRRQCGRSEPGQLPRRRALREAPVSSQSPNSRFKSLPCRMRGRMKNSTFVCSLRLKVDLKR